MLKTGKEINSGAVQADAFHHRSDAITSAAAFVGITIALIGGEHYAVADDYAAMLAGVFIMYNAYGIARPAIGELLDESLEPDLSAIIQNVSKEVRGVDLVEKCYIRKMGPGYQVDLHLWVDGNKLVSEGHQISHEVKDRIILEIPRVLDVQIHIEPREFMAEKQA